VHGIFPKADKPPEHPYEELSTNIDEFANYAGIEQDDEMWEEMKGFIKKEYVHVFKTLKDCVEYLGAKPVLSKTGTVTKIRNGKTKHRIILDAKASLVAKCADLPYRVILPRVLDFIFEILGLMCDMPADEQIFAFMCDFIDAYWIPPLHVDEQRFFVAFLRALYIVWRRTAQGSRGAGLSWGLIISLVMRLTQGVVGKIGTEDRIVRHRASGACYVDDPIFAVRGTQRDRRRTTAHIIITWMVLDFRLPFTRGLAGNESYGPVS
jgi:hypothetical protein